MRPLILGAAFVLSSLPPTFAGSPFPTISDPVVRAQAADDSTHSQAKRFIKGANGKAVPLRITDTARFAHKHERILPEVFNRKNVGLKSNCISCHLKADKGDYDFVAKNIKYNWVE